MSAVPIAPPDDAARLATSTDGMPADPATPVSSTAAAIPHRTPSDAASTVMATWGMATPIAATSGKTAPDDAPPIDGPLVALSSGAAPIDAADQDATTNIPCFGNAHLCNATPDNATQGNANKDDATPRESALPEVTLPEASLPEATLPDAALGDLTSELAPTHLPTGAAEPDRATLGLVVGARCWSLPIASVCEVLRPLLLTRVPHAPAALLGLANLRGTVLPVLSVPVLLGERGDAPRGPGARIVVIEHGAARLGLMVDAVQANGTGQMPRLDLASLLPASFAFALSSPSGGVPAASPAPTPDRAAAADRTLLGFRIGPYEFALAIDAVDAVCAAPAPAVALPGTDTAMPGVLAVRGAVLPVLDGAVLLGIDRPSRTGTDASGPTRTPTNRIVVTRVAGTEAALAVDALTGILRVPPDAIEPVPPILFRGAGTDARIVSICRLEQGRRLVQVLSPDHLLDQITMRRLAAIDRDGDAEQRMAGPADAVEEATEPMLVFMVDEERFGLPIAAVDEVLRHPGSLTRLPNAPDFLLGVTTLRGQVLPVIDQGRRFATTPARRQARPRIVVAMAGGLRVGLAVDAAAEVVRFPLSSLSAARPFSADGVFDRVVAPTDAGAPVLLLDPAAMFDAVQRDMLAAMLEHADVPGTAEIADRPVAAGRAS